MKFLLLFVAAENHRVFALNESFGRKLMSRYDSDRDEEFYRRRDTGGSGGDDRRPRGREYYADERPAPPRAGDDERARGYGREGVRRDHDDERASARSSGGGGGRGDYYRDDYDAPPRRVRDHGGSDEREEGGRSPIERAGNYVRETFSGYRGIGRGASRSHVRCRDIMTRDVTVATRETPIVEVARMMRDEDTGVIPVVERLPSLTDVGEQRPNVNRVQSHVLGGGKLVGLITDRDIAVRAVAEGKDSATRAEEIMTTDIHTAQPNDRVIDAIRKMGDKQVRRIPVVDRENNLRGIISMADVALETEEDRELAEALEEISSGASFWNRIFG